MAQIIALCGPLGSGKTTLANLLVKNHNFARTRFAASLKGMLSTFLADQGLDSEMQSRMLDGDLKEVPTEYFNGKTPRYAMQTLGTEWRDMIDKNLWIDAWERKVLNAKEINLVVDDMRFVHEAERVKKLGGTIIKILRPGFEAGEHQSEWEYLAINSDFIIHNDGAPELMLSELKLLLGDSL